MVGVDHFKLFNDRYGHQAGDDCLRQIALALRSGLRRPADLVARYGGEEFACILPDTGFDDALAIAQEMQRAVRAQKIPLCGAKLEQVPTDVAKPATLSPNIQT